MEKQTRRVEAYDRPTRQTRTWPAVIAALVFVILLIWLVVVFF